MSWHKMATIFQNYVIAKRTILPVATVTGNLPFFFFLSVVWNASALLWAETGNLSPTQILLLLKLIGKTPIDCAGVRKKL